MTAQIVTANRLGDGLVVYLARDGAWSERIADAVMAEGKDAAAALLARAEAPDQAARVVGPYPMDVIDDTGAVRPASNRETIRALGPSARTDARPPDRSAPARASEG